MQSTQSGFRRGYSTKTAVIRILSDLLSIAMAAIRLLSIRASDSCLTLAYMCTL